MQIALECVFGFAARPVADLSDATAVVRANEEGAAAVQGDLRAAVVIGARVVRDTADGTAGANELASLNAVD